MTENQTNAMQHFENESRRYARMAERCRTIQLPILGYFCDETARRMKQALELQNDAIQNPERYLVTENWTPWEK